MPVLSTAQELQAVREAIQLFSQGKTVASVTVDGMQVTYQATQAHDLHRRERELCRRLAIRHNRKRTWAQFNENTDRDYNWWLPTN